MTDFEKIVESLETPVAYCDNGGVILYANPSFSALYQAADVKGSDIKTISDKFEFHKKTCEGGFLITLKNPSEAVLEETYTDFISTVSHELRTPLTSIRGFADTMILSYEKLDSAQISKFLTIIKEQSNRLIKLIENLLAISKMRSERENLVYKSVNVKSQLETLLLMMKNRRDKRIYTLECPLNLPNVFADENKFQQIILNLLDNAHKYSEENTEIKITASESENFINIDVTDNGCGINPENLNKIFEKFARIESHLTRKAQGSGLGLFIVKNLAQKMGGKISVTSELNKGSTFTLSLPLADYASAGNKKLKESV